MKVTKLTKIYVITQLWVWLYIIISILRTLLPLLRKEARFYSSHYDLDRTLLYNCSGNDASGNYYWTYSSGKFQDSSDIVFGSTIAGVPNPIVTPLKPRWPVSLLNISYLNSHLC